MLNTIDKIADITSKFAQISFFAVTGVLAVRTYLSARRGLLNSVNTEYYKKVIATLDEIMRELRSEFDPEDPNYWKKAKSVEYFARESVNKAESYKLQLLSHPVGSQTIPFAECYDEKRILRLIVLYKNDPFIPNEIRSYLLKMLDDRRLGITRTNLNAIRRFHSFVKENKGDVHFRSIDYQLAQSILTEMTEQGCNYNQIEQKVDEFRSQVQGFFSRFDPSSTDTVKWISKKNKERLTLAGCWIKEQVNITLGRE